jgi:ABC-2 type transport system permease protein
VSDIAQIMIIARREFIERARSKVFLTTMAVLGLVIVAGIVLLSFLAGESSAITIGVGGDSPAGIAADIEAAATALEVDAVVTEYPSAEAARSAVADGQAAAVLIDGSVIVSKDTPSPTITTVFSSAANSAVRREIADRLGLSPEEVAAIVAPVQVTIEELDPEDPEEIARGVASFLAAIVLLTTIMVFGQFVAMGIVEEKQNRVVEVILSRAKTTSLLIGKVLGIGFLGLLQIMVLGAAVIVGIVLAPLPDLGVPNLTSIGVTAVIWLIIWFILGYLEYSFLYATLGATISRQEDMQSVAFIPAILIMPAYFLVTFTASTGDEPSTLVKVASFFPLWSPVVMPFRINTGTIEWWEIVVAIALVMAMIVLLVRVGARVYRGAALRTGGKVSLREAWASARD